jgi:hypothetical protein
MRVYWKTTEEPFYDTAKSSPIVYFTAGNQWAVVNLDVNNAKWIGKHITQLRLNLDSTNHAVHWVIDYVDSRYPISSYNVYSDCNNNGIPDFCDVFCGDPGGRCDVPGCGMRSDCNHDVVPDECQPDMDQNGVADVCQYAYGDFDLDGDVDQTDFGLLQTCVGSCCFQQETACKPADLSFDGSVNIADITVFVGCVTGPNTPIQASCR